MKWHYMMTDPPKINQKIYFIREFRKGDKVICEGSYGIMKKDGVHFRINGAYSAGPCPNWDVTCWADEEDFK